MREQFEIGVGSDGLVARRSFLTGALAAWVGVYCRAEEPDLSHSAEDQERRTIEAIVAKAGLRSVGTTRSPHYLGIGDASDSFRSLDIAGLRGGGRGLPGLLSVPGIQGRDARGTVNRGHSGR